MQIAEQRHGRSFFDGSSAFAAIILPSDIMLFPNMMPRPKEHRGEAAAHRESVRSMVRRRRRTRRAAPRERRAAIASSNGAKTYTVAWNENGSTYSSNDNATYWQGYAGYPVIAVLMLQGRLPLDRAAADGFAQVDWTDLNERCKRDYAAAVRAVVDERSLDAVRVEAAARKAFDAWARSTSSSNRGRPDRRSPRRREEEF